MPQRRYEDPRIANEPPTVIMRGIDADVYFTLSGGSQPQNLVDGLVYVSPHPTEAHEEAVLAIASALDAAMHANGQALVGRDCWLGERTVVQADVACVLPERNRILRGYLKGAPDLVVEVSSRGTLAFDREMKVPAYEDAAAQEIWLIDLEGGTATVFLPGKAGWQEIEAVAFGAAIPSRLFPAIGTAGLEALGG
jgi:Uma2 family endonuclease